MDQEAEKHAAHREEPETAVHEEVTLAAGTLQIAPFVTVISGALLALCLQAPLAPGRLLLAFAGAGVLFLAMLLLAWRCRSALLRMATLITWIILANRLMEGTRDLPFATGSQPIFVMGLLVGGTLWLFRRHITRLCRLDPTEGKRVGGK
jgi:hypothetical protein